MLQLSIFIPHSSFGPGSLCPRIHAVLVTNIQQNIIFAGLQAAKAISPLAPSRYKSTLNHLTPPLLPETSQATPLLSACLTDRHK